MSVLALTGGTGFVGSTVIERATAAGHAVRALTRRSQPGRAGVTWIDGALDSPDSLDRLGAGADAVIHVAGVVNAPDRAGFVAGNIEGTRAIVAAAERAGVRRFIHVSSLAAREPALSVYGWSKAEAEKIVEASALDWVMVRPPAIYGPGDMEMRDLFRLARWGIALLDARSNRRVLEADDGKPGGWTHDDFARAIGRAVGQRVLPMALPQPLLRLAARGDRLVRGARARLTPDRVAYFCHPDWTIDAEKRPDPSFWQPEVPTSEGLAATARWYRAHSLL